MKTNRNQKGFTLIEVVLVLAIGGLIFLLAFLAFQQVSVNRRDTQRRSDAGRVVAELQNYYGDKGSYPATSAATDTCGTTTSGTFGAFINTYVCRNGVFAGPQNNYTTSAGTAVVGSTLATDLVRYKKGSNCAGGGTGVSIEIGLEKGIVCRDDQ